MSLPRETLFIMDVLSSNFAKIRRNMGEREREKVVMKNWTKRERKKERDRGERDRKW